MNNLGMLSQTSKAAKNIFILFAIIFIISLVPLSYGAGYSNGLSGTAGEGNPDPVGSTAIPGNAGLFNYYLTSATGIVGSLALLVSSLAGMRKAALENATARTNKQTADMQRQMQIDEAGIYLGQKFADEQARKKKSSKTSH